MNTTSQGAAGAKNDEGLETEDQVEAMKIRELAKIRQNELELAQLNKAHRKLKLQQVVELSQADQEDEESKDTGRKSAQGRK